MQSMTGFGRGSTTTDTWQVSVEISSVNRKQAEVVLQAPRELNELDARIRKAVLAVVSRGRVQVSINVEQTGGDFSHFKIHSQLAISFSNAFKDLGKTVGFEILPTASDFLRQPGIVDTGHAAIDVEVAWTSIKTALTDALDQLTRMRSSEGSHLKSDFITRLDILISYAQKISTEAPDRVIHQREILTKRLRDSGLELDITDDRVLKEIAIFADRCDISEEITRLDSHFAKFREYLDASEPPGRALDFLCQELFREFNTIGSKANDAIIAQTVVEAKTELEKIREQVQNVE
jgi:uncharacterized protein (TIGR00255 family)